MDNDIIEECKFFGEAMQLIINNYHFEIMICLQMSVLKDDDVTRYVTGVVVAPAQQLALTRGSSALAAATAAMSGMMPPPPPLNVNARITRERRSRGGARAALQKLLESAGLTAQMRTLHLDTLGRTIKLINDYIDIEYGKYKGEMDESLTDKQIEDLLFEGTEGESDSDSDDEVKERSYTSDDDSDDEVKQSWNSSDDDKPREPGKKKPSQKRRRRRRDPLPPPPRGPTMQRNHIINEALKALVTDLNKPEIAAKILRKYMLSRTSIVITKSLVSIWYNVTMNDTLSQLLIDAYGIGSLQLQQTPSGSKMNYYDILDYVFANVTVVNDPTMNLLHRIYKIMIFWKFGKLESSNIVLTPIESEQNRNAHEVQLSAAGYILENTLYKINKPETPRGVESTGSVGGTTKKKKNLKKKKKSTKAKKKRKNNIKSKRKLKLMKKTIKVKN